MYPFHVKELNKELFQLVWILQPTKCDGSGIKVILLQFPELT